MALRPSRRQCIPGLRSCSQLQQSCDFVLRSSIWGLGCSQPRGAKTSSNDSHRQRLEYNAPASVVWRPYGNRRSLHVRLGYLRFQLLSLLRQQCHTCNTLATQYNKPIHVVETDWPESCPPEPQYNITQPVLSEPAIPVSVQGQIQWVQDIIRVVQGVPNGLGQGVNYWEPAWYVQILKRGIASSSLASFNELTPNFYRLNETSLGSNCTDAILFSADYSQYPKILGYSRESVNMYR